MNGLNVIEREKMEKENVINIRSFLNKVFSDENSTPEQIEVAIDIFSSIGLRDIPNIKPMHEYVNKIFTKEYATHRELRVAWRVAKVLLNVS